MPGEIFLTDEETFCLLITFPILLFQKGPTFLEVKKILSDIALSDKVLAI